MSQLITDWKADYTGADTNLPLEGQSPTVGPELREVKAVIRGESLNKFFYSDKIAATYVSGDDTFWIAASSLSGTVDILPGETLLLTLTAVPDPIEYWGVVKTMTPDLPAVGQVQISVFTGVHLNGTDGTLTHIRRSIYKVPAHPSHTSDETLGQTSSLPARVSCTYGQCSGVSTSLKVALPFRIPTAWNARIFGTVIGKTGAPANGAYVIKSITRDELEVTTTFQAAPGAGTAVAWLFTVYIE